MSTEQPKDGAKRPEPPHTDEQEEPVTTGDMQSVGALTPEEVEERRHITPEEEPVEENPGDQNSG